jgi:DNA-binding MurR/RpiR family transcriptional regulator
VAALAERAGVSDPTVLRFVAKLGFTGYAAFQRALIDEVGEQLNSPLSMLNAEGSADPGDDLYARTLIHLANALRQAATSELRDEIAGVVELLADERSNIFCLGGRFSTVLALRLSMHLDQLRPRVHFVENRSGKLFDVLADFGSRTILIVFDYRRYQDDIIAFARLADAAGARIVLFTDRWRSPIAEVADRVIISPVETLSPFDSKVVAMAQTEALVATLIQRNPAKARSRLAAIEALRERGYAPERGAGRTRRSATTVGGMNGQGRRERRVSGTPSP